MRTSKRHYSSCVSTCQLLLSDMRRRDIPNGCADSMAETLLFLFKMGASLPTVQERRNALQLAHDLADAYWATTSDTRIASVQGILETILNTESFSLDNALLSNAA